MKKNARRATVIFGGLLLAYLSVYVLLSSWGHYQVIEVDINRVIAYSWAPEVYYVAIQPPTPHHTKRTGGWSAPIFYAFLPLWILDTKYVHEDYFPLTNDDRPLGTSPD